MTNGAEQFDIVDVVAYVANVRKRDTELVTDLLCSLQFGKAFRVHTTAYAEIEVLQFEFLRARFDNERVL